MKLSASEKRKVIKAFSPFTHSFEMVWGEGMIEKWEGSQFLEHGPEGNVIVSLRSNWGRSLREVVDRFTGTPEQWCAATQGWV